MHATKLTALSVCHVTVGPITERRNGPSSSGRSLCLCVRYRRLNQSRTARRQAGVEKTATARTVSANFGGPFELFPRTDKAVSKLPSRSRRRVRRAGGDGMLRVGHVPPSTCLCGRAGAGLLAKHRVTKSRRIGYRCFFDLFSELSRGLMHGAIARLLRLPLSVEKK